MKKSISKLLCALALSSVLAASVLAAENEIDIWVSKLFPLPNPTVTTSETGIVVSIEKPGIPYGIDCQIGTALYDGDGRMLDAQFMVTDNRDTYVFNYGANKTAANVKLFVFETSAGFKPIYESTQAPVK